MALSSLCNVIEKRKNMKQPECLFFSIHLGVSRWSKKSMFDSPFFKGFYQSHFMGGEEILDDFGLLCFFNFRRLVTTLALFRKLFKKSFAILLRRLLVGDSRILSLFVSSMVFLHKFRLGFQNSRVDHMLISPTWRVQRPDF